MRLSLTVTCMHGWWKKMNKEAETDFLAHNLALCSLSLKLRYYYYYFKFIERQYVVSVQKRCT